MNHPPDNDKFRGNIDHWIRRSEPDYYLIFIGAWIPFNAWYVKELPSLNKSDRKIIRELQDSGVSKPRLILEGLLRSDTKEGKQFRENLALLHIALEDKPYYHNGFKLTFSELLLSENPQKHANDSDGINVFKAENKQSYFEMIAVDGDGKSFLDYRSPSYDIDNLKKDTDFIKIPDRRTKERIIECFKLINPSKPINLVSTSRIRAEYLVLDSEGKVKFINDPTTISKACIKVLYSLRCMLFHGEIEPTRPYMAAYQHAYYLLQNIVKGLQ